MHKLFWDLVWLIFAYALTVNVCYLWFGFAFSVNNLQESCITHTTVLCMSTIHLFLQHRPALFVSCGWSQGPWRSLGVQSGVWRRQCGLLSLRCAGRPPGPTARSPLRKRVFPTRRRSNKRMTPPLDPLNRYPGWLTGWMMLTVSKVTVNLQ